MAAFDVVFVLPYPFADHPSFPEGILKRALEQAGFSVGVIEKPLWQAKESFTVLGRPRLFFAIVPGPVDSMVVNYTASRKRRREDLYQVDGHGYFPGSPRSVSFRIRPDRTLIVFANRVREAYREVPVVIGGVEATMRRFSHYDFQEDAVRRPILLDARADLLVTGMGEKQLPAIARLLAAGKNISEVVIPGTARMVKASPARGDFLMLPSHEEIQADAGKLIVAQMLVSRAVNSGQGIVQPVQNLHVVQEPFQNYVPGDLDRIYGLGYARRHLHEKRMTPALRMNLFSITSHRGCFGGCSFCSIQAHQGRRVLSRSQASIVREIESQKAHPDWTGVISDIGGATAEMYGSDCRADACARDSCLLPASCSVLGTYGERYLDLLRECRSIAGVKKIFVGSGLRYDLLMQNHALLEEIMRFHSGRFLRVAPEHTEEGVLGLMGKPGSDAFREFVRVFNAVNRGLLRRIELALYLVVGHPGERAADVREMKKKLKSLKLKHLDVQVFTPTPGTLSTAMYASGLGPDGRPVPVERSVRELERRKKLLLD